jgi:hypothetical protein
MSNRKFGIAGYPDHQEGVNMVMPGMVIPAVDAASYEGHLSGDDPYNPIQHLMHVSSGQVRDSLSLILDDPHAVEIAEQLDSIGVCMRDLNAMIRGGLSRSFIIERAIFYADKDRKLPEIDREGMAELIGGYYDCFTRTA